MTRPRKKQAHESLLHRMSRETDTVTVTVTRTDGARFSRVGYGDRVTERITDAYAQLPPGEYVVDAVSTPGSVYSDACGRDRMLADRPSSRIRSGMNAYEGKRVVVA